MTENQMVTLDGDHPTTNTLIIAEHFGKKHQHVMRDVRALMSECPEEFGLSNFGQTPYYDSQGKKQTMYSLTRDGFMLLSMGFTGSNATRLKIAFIEEFNRMEAALHQPLQRPDQVEELQARRTREELLKAKPLWTQIQRYLEKGLKQLEISLLTRKSVTTIRSQMKLMAACGLIQYTVNPLLSEAGKRGNQKRLRLIGGSHVK
jgi:Rha family phage regulatory protein